MRFASLGSGSEGNGLIVESGATRILLDCGFGIADTSRRLARLGLQESQVDAIFVTHEHDDHIGGAARFAARHDIPVYLTYGTMSAVGASRFKGVDINVIDSHTPLAINDIEVTPYPVPHDAREPSQFVFGNGMCRLGVLTDAGCGTSHIETMLSGVDALVLECNHDLDLLMNSRYPTSLKKRISGRLGHLDNASSARLLSRIDRSRLKHVIAAHLSKQNNTVELARGALAEALGCEADWIGVASQEEGFFWRELT
jgi:phosphoribosyl 1,2-cyclic phosphodiesterase